MLDVPDVDVLVALALPHHAAHRRALAWWRKTERYALTPFTETALLRLLMTPAIAGAPVTFGAACEVVASVAGDPRADFLADDASLRSADFDTSAIRGAKQVTDAHLVALARKHRARLITLDARMPASLGLDAADAIAVIG